MSKVGHTAQTDKPRPARRHSGEKYYHESAHKHVTGQAIYVDDIPEAKNCLHIAVGGSAHAHARIKNIDLSAVAAAPGVVCVITYKDVPGQLDIGPVFPGDPMLVTEICEFVSQPIFAVAAESHAQAKQAVSLAKVDYDILEPTLTIDRALADQLYVRPTHRQCRGNAEVAIENAKNQLSGQIYIKGQEHFYLEGQVCMVCPTEDAGMMVYTSSQHPTEVQKLVAEVLDLRMNRVQVEVRRMGGGFGGKETQAASLACIAAVLAHKTGRNCKYRMARQDDMVMTGKRHDFQNSYTVGVDEHGIIQGAKISLAGKCGNSPDLSDAIVDRAMFHCDNAYYLNQVIVEGLRCKTHTVSATAFRGFGGPQGMLLAETMMDDIARHLGEDPLTIRRRNCYGVTHKHICQSDGSLNTQNSAAQNLDPRNQTHYGQVVVQNVLPGLIDQLTETSDYWRRRKAIKAFNQQNYPMKKGLALTPVKFGISFTVQHLNQAGALVHIYSDGSIHLNHGGTEMGQGLFIKVAQVVADVFQVEIERIQVSATRTDKVPNTSPTAASAGSDLNGMAAKSACEKIKADLIAFAEDHYNAEPNDVSFHDSCLLIRKTDQDELRVPFSDFIQLAYLNRVPLSATGFYKTPKIHYDRATGQGRPFYYFAHGAAVSEVMVDILTGEYKVLRVDILQDVGQSLNPAIDRGQIEGGFIQGMGWLTTEELLWDDAGKLLSNSPANYKIPAVGDTPIDFRVDFLSNTPNSEATIYRSKAVGEPPFMLAISVWSALRDAVSSLSDYRLSPKMDAPATPECILSTVTAIQSQYRTQHREKHTAAGDP
jgi:xanthine dehydrogenase large subunit